MMDKRLNDVLAGREDNYLLPFYWQHGDHHDRITEQIERIRRSGCRAICVESRPHPDFCREGWWRDMDLILAECEKRSLKVWILDDKRFPTGLANDAIVKEHPDLRPWTMIERHVDVMGPAPMNALIVPPAKEGEMLLHVVAERRMPGNGQRLEGTAMELTDQVKDGILFWDVPDGCWRVFYIWKSRRGIDAARIDFTSEKSCRVLLDAVYEPHYKRYARYFGNVLAGFFSDEPQFHNWLVGEHLDDKGMYHYGTGQEGLALPYSDDILGLMATSLMEVPTRHLGELWYPGGGSCDMRLAYMDALTYLYHRRFSRQIGDWCRAHGVEYIGHVIEDMNAHGRMGFGAGHYFRAIEGQDMGGIDIVLHQVMPGFADYDHTMIALGGASSPDFFHYILPKLASSISRICPHMKGRAMCEVFGAYGWAEGARMMRWLLDFLLVRGVNHFVPHAFSPKFPDPDCPPHFGAEGHDPQFDGFAWLMRYANKAAHLLSGARRVAPIALLYHAEGEWMSGEGEAMLMQEPARALYDAHIDFEIVPADSFTSDSSVVDGRLVIGDCSFQAIVVPGARYLPEGLRRRFGELRDAGIPVFFAGEVPQGITGEPVAVADIPSAIGATVEKDVVVEGEHPLLRVLHLVRDGKDVVMFFNESPSLRATTVAHLPAKGPFARLRILEDVATSDETADGAIAIDLLPGQSEIILFGDDAGLPKSRQFAEPSVITPEFAIELADADDLDTFKPYIVTDKLFDVTSADRLPSFAGRMRYTFKLDLGGEGEAPLALDLGEVGETARLWVNGAYAGIRIARPYRFEIGGLAKGGENEFVVEVANNLARRVRDPFSEYIQLGPSGLLGPMTIATCAKVQ